MRISLRTIVFTLAVFVGGSQVSAAQITLTSSDFLGLIGTSQRVISDTTFNVTVDVGSDGANQTWDLSSITVSGLATDRMFLDPSQTPFAADFPTANFAQRSTGEEFQGEFYSYNRVESNSVSDLGTGFVSVDPDTSFVEFEESPDPVALPVSFNDSWLDTARDTVGDLSVFGFVSIDSTWNVVDGWGTLQLGIGTYDVLRLRSNDTETTETYATGVMVSSETTTYISYEWISKTHFLVASVESQENETNPSFTSAGYVEILSALTTSVEGDLPDQDQAVLVAAYPNPFRSEMTVEYESDGNGVDLAVFDLLGRRVRTLEDGRVPSGSRVVSWDGTSDGGSSVANGVYLVRLEAGGGTDTRRVVLIR